MPYKIGIDVGGTKVLGVILQGSRILRQEKIEMTDKTPEGFMRSIKLLIKFLLNGKSPRGSTLGMTFPGLVEKGCLVKAPNLQYMEGFDFSKAFPKCHFKKISFANDAACYALGEAVRLKRKNLVGITLGTGVGCGVIIDGRIYCGGSNSVELSHMIIKPNGRRCTCGSYGCLEEYFSARALLRETKKVFGKEVDAYELKRLSDKGDRRAIRVCKILGFYLGIGLGNASNILNPEIISISGGLAKNRLIVRYGVEEMRRVLYCYEPKIVLGKYESAAVGAASL